jgi:hypothetical protein
MMLTGQEAPVSEHISVVTVICSDTEELKVRFRLLKICFAIRAVVPAE